MKTNAQPQVGDVIRSLLKSSITGEWTYIRVDDESYLGKARKLIATGRWVIVDQHPAEAVDTGEQ